MRFVFMALTLSVSLLVSKVNAESYYEVEKAVFKTPLTKLPSIDGISISNVLGALIAHKGQIVKDSHSIFESESDFRESRVKLLHPRGVCSKGEWIINRNSHYTGLFANDTRVPVIMRFSSGTGDSAKANEDSKRIFGFAIKLFPTQNPYENVTTNNIIALDQYGFEASDRWSYFYEDNSLRRVYFTNVAPAKSFLGKTLATFFDRFDKPNFARLVYKTAQVDQYNRRVNKPVYPYELRFVPVKNMPIKKFKDFRHEIVDLNKRSPIELDIWVNQNEHAQNDPVKLGKIILTKSVVSEACDKTLHFHHNRTPE